MSEKAAIGRRPSSRWPLVAVIALFVVSRVGFYLAGIRFDTTPLPYFWQYLDPVLLKTRLLESLFYLHSQPPLYNLYLGLILKIFPNPGPAFWMTSLLMGFVLAVALFRLMARLGIRQWLSATLTIVFMLSPTAILYENWLFYTYPLIIILVLAALFLHRFVSSGRTKDLAVFSSLLAIACLTISFFHILWMVVILLGVWALTADQRGLTPPGELRSQRTEKRSQKYSRLLRSLFALLRSDFVRVACLPLLVVFLWYGKNAIFFRSFSSSTWFGMNLNRITTSFMNQDDLRQLVAQDGVSGVSLVGPFSPLDAYREYVTEAPATGIPALDERTREGGAANFNNPTYIELSKQYVADDLKILRFRPRNYLRNLLDAWLVFFMPASSNRQVRDNVDQIRPWVILYELGLQGRFMYYIEPELKNLNTLKYYGQKILNMGLFLLVAYVLAVWFGLRQAARAGRNSALGVLLLFFVFNFIYVAAAGNFLELGENMRFRSMIDPFMLAVVGLFVNQILTRRGQET
jgi:hypothetical protein